MPPKTAFTAVSVSPKLKGPQTLTPLGTASQSQQGQQEQQQQSNQDWPPALKAFLEKCFKQILPENKAVLESQLKQLIAQKAQLGQIWSTNWNYESLPILEQQRIQQSQQSKYRKFEKIDRTKTNSQKSDQFHKKIGPQKNKSSTSDKNDDDLFNEDARLKRQRRFEKESSPVVVSHSPTPIFASQSDLQPIIGRSKQLEKRYLRLTSAPDPDNVRPVDILKQTLALLKQKWKAEQNYAYICDQFKSLRQDLTVQHVETEFTVQVYEIHARIALEKGDLGEYNQCQSRLKELYNKGIKGNETEFLAYRILYLVHTQNRAEIAHILKQTLRSNESMLVDPWIKHALDVDRALAAHNYHGLFQLYVDAPNMGGYVMDAFVKRERLAALARICSSYRGELPIKHIVNELKFDSVSIAVNFLKEDAGAILTADNTNLLPKESMPVISAARARAFDKVDIKGQV